MKTIFIITSLSVLLALTLAEDPTDCPKVCPLSFRPVCARNSLGELKTFSNECKLKAKNCFDKTDFAKEHDGPCPKVAEDSTAPSTSSTVEDELEE